MNFLPSKDRQYFEDKGLLFEEVVDGTQKGVIIQGFQLPPGRYDIGQADILILIPPGYPDLPPDMFYLLPWARLVQAARYPRAADQPFKLGASSG